MKLNYEWEKVKNPLNIALFLLTAILISLCYRTTLYWMYERYIGADSYYSHGFIIPFVSGFLIWQKRKDLSKVSISGSTTGLLLVGIAIATHVGGVILKIYFLSGISLFLLIIGIILFTFGKKFTETLIFPIGFILFMIPLPMHLIEMLSFPMKIMVAKAGVLIVRSFGIPILSEGFHISISSGSLLVGNPCSGLRSLIAFLAIGAIVAYFGSMPLALKFIVFLSSAPIAILSNIVRVTILILISQYYGLEAAAPETYLHTGSGIFTFALGFFALSFTSRKLETD